MIERRRAIIATESQLPPIPSGYKRVQYIEKNSNRDTGHILIPTPIQWDQDVKFGFQGTSTEGDWDCIFAWGGDGCHSWMVTRNNPRWVEWCIGGRDSTDSVLKVSHDYLTYGDYEMISSSSKKFKLTVNTASVENTFSSINIPSGCLYTVFARNYGNTRVYGVYGKIYYVQIYNNGKLVFDAYPVVKTSTNTAMMYDRVSQSEVLCTGFTGIPGPEIVD